MSLKYSLFLRMVCFLDRSGETVCQPHQRNLADADDAHISDSRSLLLNTDAEPDEVQVHVNIKQRKPSLLRTLMRVFGPKLLQAQLCKLVADALIFCGPLLQRFACLSFASALVMSFLLPVPRRLYFYRYMYLFIYWLTGLCKNYSTNSLSPFLMAIFQVNLG